MAQGESSHVPGALPGNAIDLQALHAAIVLTLAAAGTGFKRRTLVNGRRSEKGEVIFEESPAEAIKLVNLLIAGLAACEKSVSHSFEYSTFIVFPGQPIALRPKWGVVLAPASISIASGLVTFPELQLRNSQAGPQCDGNGPRVHEL